ncbi:MAG: heavy metal translocating P-type ATPase [Flavobacteriales bacterium]
MRTPSPTLVACYHCGEPCIEDHVREEGKDFCCQGCKAVFGLLRDSGLKTYYELEKRPGTRSVANADEARAELFDLPEVRDKLVEFSEDGITRVTLQVPQMHCSSCIWLLENLDRLEPAVVRSRVRFSEKELSVNFREGDLSLGQLIGLLRKIGYGPQLTGSAGKSRKEKQDRMLFIRLGVAGFCFGNTMFLSFPEYLGAKPDTEALVWYFSLMKIMLALPVVFFSGKEFFTSAWAGLRSRTVNIDQPIAVGIVALFSQSLFEAISGSGPGYFDSLAGLVFFLLIGRWFQAFTYRALSFDRDLDDFLPLVVLRRNGTAEEHVSVAELQVGDTIIVRDQELVPVDGILRKGSGRIDNSFITGEPLPMRKALGETIKAGGRQRGAAIEVEVLLPFAKSHLKRLWEEQRETGGERPLMPRTMDLLARRFITAVFLISAGAAVYWWLHDPTRVWTVVTAVLIVACPCALALSMPFAYGHTIRLLGKSGLFLRDADVVERMASVDTVVFDKTGTLTAREAWSMHFEGAALSAHEQTLVRSLARHSVHPLSAVIYEGSKVPLTDAVDVEDLAGQGVRGTVRGIHVSLGNEAFTHAPAMERTQGEAYVYFALDGVFRGRFAIRKKAREGMAESVRAVRDKATTYLLTGDTTVDAETAAMFAPGQMVTGCTPPEKAAFVNELRKKGGTVMMVGDGLNDAGALQQSDVGVTVSESSAALAPASDAIIDARALHKLPRMLHLGRKAHRIVIASLALSLAYNVVGLSFAVTGNLTPLIAAILMPVSSVTVVSFVSIAVWRAARSEGLGR